VRFLLWENVQPKAARPPANLQKSVLSPAAPKRNFQKCPTRDKKEKRMKCYKETLGRAATKTQHCIKNIGQIKVSESLVISINFPLG